MTGKPWDLADTQYSYIPVTESDLLRIYGWIKRPHIFEWWGKPTWEDYAEGKREDFISPCWNGYVVYQASSPLCYIQSWRQGLDQDPWWPGERKGMVNVDLFIVEETLCNKGLGAAILSEFSECLLRHPDVDLVTIDPKPENSRAIRCYEKAGFSKLGQYETSDGPALFLVKQ